MQKKSPNYCLWPNSRTNLQAQPRTLNFLRPIFSLQRQKPFCSHHHCHMVGTREKSSSLPHGTREKASKHMRVGKQWGVRALPSTPGITNTILLEIQIQIQYCLKYKYKQNTVWNTNTMGCEGIAMPTSHYFSCHHHHYYHHCHHHHFLHSCCCHQSGYGPSSLSIEVTAPQKRFNGCSGDCVNQQCQTCHIWWFLWEQNYVIKYANTKLFWLNKNRKAILLMNIYPLDISLF